MEAASFADRDGWIWMNGELVPWREANVHVLTHGLHYASSVFEGQRSYEGKVFKLEEHTQRLFNSAEMLDMAVPYTLDEVNEACNLALEKNGLRDAYCRPLVWRGAETMGVSAQNARINVAIAVWSWPAYFSMEQRLKGLRLEVSKWRRPSPETAPVHAKAAGLYMICTLARHTAQANGYDDAFMFDYRGQVAEATGANVFFVKGDEIITPTPDCILDGITRRTVKDLAARRGFNIVERAVMPDELEGFEQCFLTGTAAEVSPVSQIGPYTFEVGAVCKQLMEDYDKEVRAHAYA